MSGGIAFYDSSLSGWWIMRSKVMRGSAVWLLNLHSVAQSILSSVLWCQNDSKLWCVSDAGFANTLRSMDVITTMFVVVLPRIRWISCPVSRNLKAINSKYYVRHRELLAANENTPHHFVPSETITQTPLHAPPHNPVPSYTINYQLVPPRKVPHRTKLYSTT